ncbi:MAG: hypothetical protein K0B37_14185 [Bacteroidales bacterium]|nr:hypothetical protein [Bacteroidales bacterium]
MKNLKSFLAKNFLILAFAVGGVFAVTSNVTVSGNNPPETGTGDGIKYCMRTGGGIMIYARACLYPGYHSLPAHQCGSRVMIWNGLRLEQCF